MGNQQGNKNSDLESDHGSGVLFIISPKSLRKASRGRKEKKLWMMSSVNVGMRMPMRTTEPLSLKVLKNEKGQREDECPRTPAGLKNKEIAKDSRSFEEDLSSEHSEYENGFETDSDETHNLHLIKERSPQEKSKTTDMIQFYRCGNEGMEQQEATFRVRDKTVEVENIIHQVFCSLDSLRGSTHASTAGGFLRKVGEFPFGALQRI